MYIITGLRSRTMSSVNSLTKYATSLDLYPITRLTFKTMSSVNFLPNTATVIQHKLKLKPKLKWHLRGNCTSEVAILNFYREEENLYQLYHKKYLYLADPPF